jgi:hypothetical protein
VTPAPEGNKNALKGAVRRGAQITCRIPTALMERIDTECQRLCISRADLVIRLLSSILSVKK